MSIWCPRKLLKPVLWNYNHFVCICEFTSRIFRLIYGDPQGSDIGSLMCCLFLNDCINCLKFSNFLKCSTFWILIFILSKISFKSCKQKLSQILSNYIIRIFYKSLFIEKKKCLQHGNKYSGIYTSR